MLPEGAGEGISAQVTAAHRGRYDIVSDRGADPARIKGSKYYNRDEVFPTTGDFVMLDWQESGSPTKQTGFGRPAQPNLA